MINKGDADPHVTLPNEKRVKITIEVNLATNTPRPQSTDYYGTYLFVDGMISKCDKLIYFDNIMLKLKMKHLP